MVTNGQIDLRQLHEISPGRYVSPGCARAWAGFSAAMGGLTVGTAADSCYRNLAWQEYRYAHRPPAAAFPGTSKHGLGQAIDIGNYYRFSHATLVAVGRRYGFVFDTPSEAWHIRYTGEPAYYPLTASSGSSSLRKRGRQISMDYVWMVNSNSRSGAYTNGELYYQRNIGGPFKRMTAAEYQARAQILLGMGVSDSANPLAFRYTIAGDEIEKLVAVYGGVTKLP